jgi:hypothetical protein
VLNAPPALGVALRALEDLQVAVAGVANVQAIASVSTASSVRAGGGSRAHERAIACHLICGCLCSMAITNCTPERRSDNMTKLDGTSTPSFSLMDGNALAVTRMYDRVTSRLSPSSQLSALGNPETVCSTGGRREREVCWWDASARGVLIGLRVGHHAR